MTDPSIEVIDLEEAVAKFEPDMSVGYDSMNDILAGHDPETLAERGEGKVALIINNPGLTVGLVLKLVAWSFKRGTDVCVFAGDSLKKLPVVEKFEDRGMILRALPVDAAQDFKTIITVGWPTIDHDPNEDQVRAITYRPSEAAYVLEYGGHI
jgi:hypothetical protein